MPTGQHHRAGAGRGLSPAPVSPAAGPACPVHGVSSASVSPENAHMPGDGAVLTESPGAQSSPDVSSAPPRSPLPGPQPQPPVSLEDGMWEVGQCGYHLHVCSPSFCVGKPVGSQIYSFPLPISTHSIFPKPYDLGTIISHFTDGEN